MGTGLAGRQVVGLTNGSTRVAVLTRSGCHLCEDAEQVVRDVCTRTGTGYRMVDVDSDPQLRAAYTDHVPVTVVDNAVLSYWFIEAAALAAALERPAG